MADESRDLPDTSKLLQYKMAVDQRVMHTIAKIKTQPGIFTTGAA